MASTGQIYPNPSGNTGTTFDQIGSGENTSATMTMGAGAQLIPDPTTPGVIAATQIQSTPVSLIPPLQSQALVYDSVSGTYIPNYVAANGTFQRCLGDSVATVQITSNVLTVVLNDLAVAVGDSFTFTQMTAATFLNSQTVMVLTSNPFGPSFTAAFSHADLASTADTGYVTIVGQTYTVAASDFATNSVFQFLGFPDPTLGIQVKFPNTNRAIFAVINGVAENLQIGTIANPATLVLLPAQPSVFFGVFNSAIETIQSIPPIPTSFVDTYIAGAIVQSNQIVTLKNVPPDGAFPCTATDNPYGVCSGGAIVGGTATIVTSGLINATSGSNGIGGYVNINAGDPVTSDASGNVVVATKLPILGWAWQSNNGNQPVNIIVSPIPIATVVPQKVTTTVDFVNPDFPEDTTASVTVTGQSWVTSGSVILAGFGGTTADHEADDAMVEGLTAYIENIVAGVGFDITAHAPLGTWGNYEVYAIGVA